MRIRVVIIAGITLLIAGALVFLYLLMQAPATPSANRPAPTSTASPTPTAPAAPTPTSKPAGAKTPEPTATPRPEATPTTGTLTIESDVPDTTVFLDRVFLGTAPVTAPDVRPGPHTLNLSATGYDGITESIDVVPGPRTVSIKFKEVKLNVTLAALHKHTIGSCSGTLHATPQGLTYDTSNKDDGFTTPLTSIETFTFDYAEKNLRVKIKNGKTLNFTPADGNVQKLYEFHRDVDKARQRLVSGK